MPNLKGTIQKIRDKIERGEEIEATIAATREYTPHPKQELFHRSMARVRALFTGNRFGKTDATIREALMWAKGEHPYREIPPTPNAIRYYVDGYQGDHYKDVVLPKFRKFVDPADIGGEFNDVFLKGERLLQFPNGSSIKFLSYNLQDSERTTQAYGGAEVDLHIFDEHGAIEIYREAGARIGPGVRPEIVVAYTPLLGRAAWEYKEIYQRWEKGEAGYDCITGTIWDNPYLKPADIEEYLETLPPEQRSIREGGIFTIVGGAVYLFTREKHFIPFDALRVAAATKSLIIDPHPSRTKGHHILWCAVDQDQRMFCYRERIYRVPIPKICDEIRAECQADASLNEDVRRYWIDPHWGWEDNESGKSIAEQYQENGIPVQPASNDKTGGIQLMQTALEVSPSIGRAMFEVMDRCPETADQFEAYSWLPQTTAMRVADRWRTNDERDDFVTCARYFAQTNPRFQGRRISIPKPHLSPIMRNVVPKSRGWGDKPEVRGVG